MKKPKRILCAVLALLMLLGAAAAVSVRPAYATKTEAELVEEQRTAAQVAALEQKKKEQQEKPKELEKQTAEAKAKKNDVMATKNLLDQRNQLLLEQIDDTQNQIDDAAAHEVALRSRGTPRIANALLRRVRDFAMVKGEGRIDLEITQIGLAALNLDSRGLDQMDNKILGTIIEKFGGGPVGLNTIATAVGEDAGTIEEVYEPFLIKEGFLKRTPRGREATELAYRHMGFTPPGGSDTLLF